MKGLEHVDEKPNLYLKEAKCEIYKISLTLPPTGNLYGLKIHVKLCKVGCTFPIVISSELRVGQY